MSDVLKELERHLPLELGANVRYAGHARILKVRGYNKLADKYSAEAEEERVHADAIIQRIMELGKIPDYDRVNHVVPLKEFDIEELLQSDLSYEEAVMESLTTVIDCAEHESCYATSEVARHLVRDTQEHITWLLSQVQQIKELGKTNYLQAQL